MNTLFLIFEQYTGAELDLNNLILFKKIAEIGSITKTAAELTLPKSAVSQKLARLEEELGTRLFHRNTRKIALTEVGDIIYRHALQISAERDSILETIASRNDEVSGLIRMTAPPDMGIYLTKTVLKKITKDHPGIRIELDLSTRYVDLINEGFDLAIRATGSGLNDSNLVAAKLHSTEIRLFAASSYLESSAAIGTPDDIKLHPTVAFSSQPGLRTWPLKLTHRVDKTTATISLTPSIITSTFQGVFEAIIAGMGVGMMPIDLCRDALESKKICLILPDWKVGDASFYAVYPSKKYLSARVKLMLEYLQKAW